MLRVQSIESLRGITEFVLRIKPVFSYTHIPMPMQIRLEKEEA